MHKHYSGMFGCPKKDRFDLEGLLGKQVSVSLTLAGGLLGFLGQKDGLDVGQDTSLGDGDTGQELVQFLVIADGQLEMTWDDSGLLVVTGGVTCQLENFSSQVFQNCGKVDWGSGTDTLGVVAFSQKTVDTTHGELKSGTG